MLLSLQIYPSGLYTFDEAIYPIAVGTPPEFFDADAIPTLPVRGDVMFLDESYWLLALTLALLLLFVVLPLRLLILLVGIVYAFFAVDAVDGFQLLRLLINPP